MRKLDRRKVILSIQIFIVFIFILSIVVGINLQEKFKQARNLVRLKHMETIMNAIYTYYIVNQKFPDCIPQSGDPIEVEKCKEIESFLTSFPKDPSKNQKYFIEYVSENKNGIRIFSSSPEAKGIEIIR